METVRKPYAAESIPNLQMASLENTIRTALEEIGLSQHEIALYRTALTLGPRPASTLAKGIRIQRTRVYDLLSSLQSRGLIEMVERNRVRYYIATPPDRLLSLIRDRKEYVEQQLNHLEDAIPKLFANSDYLPSSVESRTVRGVTQVKELLEALLQEENSSILAIGDIEQVLRTHIGTSRWAGKFRETRIARNISLRISLQGPPDFLEEKSLLRESLSSPDIPSGALMLATDDTIVALEFSGMIQATHFQSEVVCSILRGLYDSWFHAVERIA